MSRGSPRSLPPKPEGFVPNSYTTSPNQSREALAPPQASSPDIVAVGESSFVSLPRHVLCGAHLAAVGESSVMSLPPLGSPHRVLHSAHLVVLGNPLHHRRHRHPCHSTASALTIGHPGCCRWKPFMSRCSLLPLCPDPSLHRCSWAAVDGTLGSREPSLPVWHATSAPCQLSLCHPNQRICGRPEILDPKPVQMTCGSYLSYTPAGRTWSTVI